MIHVVTDRNRALYRDTLLQMHRLRKIHFVDERRWEGAIVHDDGEYDRYDDERAVYLLAIEPDGQIACSMRLRPTDRGSVLQDVFPHLVGPGQPDLLRREVWEISRYFASGAVRGRRGALRQTEMRLAALEAALAHKVEMMVGIVDLELLARLMDCSGWRVALLGDPAPYADGVAQAVAVEVSLEALVEMQESQGVACPISLRACPSCDRDISPPEIEVLSQVRTLSPGRRRMAIDLMRSFVQAEPELTSAELSARVGNAASVIRGRIEGSGAVNMR